jgi:hypothetical protein
MECALLTYDSGVIGGSGLNWIGSDIVLDCHLNFLSAVVSWRGVQIGGGRLIGSPAGRLAPSATPLSGRLTEFLRGSPCSD